MRDTPWNRSDGVRRRSAVRSACTPATVAGLPFCTTTRTRLFLSRNATRAADPVCAHPSGYFIEKPPFGSVNVTKTWLSGMSPVAADPASPSSAFGDWVGELELLGAVVAGGAGGGGPGAFSGVPDAVGQTETGPVRAPARAGGP